MLKHTLFISDLHLDPNTPAITQAFFEFLNVASSADELYILGDFFEAWIGDDDENDLICAVSERLRTLAQSVPIYIMRGNRDFLMGERFTNACAATLIKEPTVINLYGKGTLLLHGDLLCTEDWTHQLFRKVAYHDYFRWLALQSPLTWRRRIGKLMRKHSRNKTQQLAPIKMDATESAVLYYMQRYRTTQLIHGHTHRPAVHSVKLPEEETARRIVLGAWDDRPSFLQYFANHEIESSFEHKMSKK